MAKKPVIALPALHWWLWEQRTGSTVRVNLTELAPLLGVSSEGLRSALGRMARDGRITNTPHRYVYEIVDPAEFVVTPAEPA